MQRESAELAGAPLSAAGVMDGAFAGLVGHVTRPVFLLAVMMLVADGVYVGLHVLEKFGLYENVRLLLWRERGFAEMFQYLKWLWLGGLCVLLALTPGLRGYLAWALMFVVLLLDDVGGLHETGGRWMVAHTDSARPWGLLPAQDLGELAVWVVSAMVLLPLLALSYWRSRASVRATMRVLVMLMVLLVLCGGVADMAYILIGESVMLNSILTIVEDGGEMLAATLMLVVVFREVSLRALPWLGRDPSTSASDA